MDCFAENHYFGPQTTENRSGTWAAAQCLSRRMGVSNAAASKALGPATEREAVGSIAHEQNVGAVSVLQRINLCHSYLGSAKAARLESRCGTAVSAHHRCPCVLISSLAFGSVIIISIRLSRGLSSLHKEKEYGV